MAGNGKGGRGGPCLSVCDVTRCEAMCCHDGAYLEDSEVAFLTELVARVPQLRAVLPEPFLVEGWWNGEHLGTKTATRPHAYANPGFPAHFARTRCVFADAQGFCALEKLARERGLHPWTFKPAVCWMFPLQEEGGEPEPPPLRPQDDPYRAPGYPGYATFVTCGRHDPAGKPWREALSREIAYLRAARGGLPILGTPGHTVDDLLAPEPPRD